MPTDLFRTGTTHAAARPNKAEGFLVLDPSWGKRLPRWQADCAEVP